jgi:hypothetical protein
MTGEANCVFKTVNMDEDVHEVSSTGIAHISYKYEKLGVRRKYVSEIQGAEVTYK